MERSTSEGDPTVGSVRQRRRLREMKQVQRCAVERFAARGFAEVSVEEVAQAAEISPVSIYRWFGSKERLVLWDEYDPQLLAAVREGLRQRQPLEAVRHAVITELDKVYDVDRELVLARAQLIHSEPALLAAARWDAHRLEAGLRDMLADTRTEEDAFAGSVLAAVAVSVLVAAVDAWQADDGRTSLGALVDRGFAVLEERAG